MYGSGTRPYMIRTRPCTRPCTVHTVVFTACVHSRVRLERTGYMAVHGPCTLYTGVFMFTAHEHGTFYGPCTRPCTDLVHGHERAPYMAVNSHVHGQRPCSRSVHGGHGRERPCTLSVNTTVYRVHSRTLPCTGHGRTMYMACARSCTQSVHDPGHVPCTWAALYTGRKHRCVRVHDRVHGRVACTRPCLRPVYRAAHEQGT